MRKELNVLYQIACTTGAGSQESIMKLISLNDSEILKYFFKIAFDPLFQTHIKKIEIIPSSNAECTFEQFKSIIDIISNKPAVTNEDRYIVNDFISSNYWTDTERLMLTKIFTKSLNIGISGKTVNKFYHNLIPTPFLMKADPDTEIIRKWFEEGKQCFAEFKYDGVRGCAIMMNNEVQSILTYDLNDLDLNLLPNLVRRINSISAGFNPHVIDFEITSNARTRISGEINKILKHTAPIGIDEDWIINVFDMFDYNVIKNKKSVDNQAARRAKLEKVFTTNNVAENVVLSKIYNVSSYDELLEVFDEVIKDGYEGLVVKDATALYETRRTKTWVKMKGINDCDLKIVSWFPGKANTKREHTIGGFTLESADGKLKVNVGSGFSDKLIEEIMQNGPDSYIGTIATIRYNMVIGKKDSDTKSLFLPRFLEFRVDKHDADPIERIKVG